MNAQDKYRINKKRNGICVNCGTNKLGKYKRCDQCHEKIVAANKCRREIRLSHGLCVNCGKIPHIKDQTRCEKCRQKDKDWYKNSEYRERSRILDIERRQLRKLRIFEHYGNKCMCCGETNHMFLSMDHINNDGANHRKQIFSSSRRGKTSGTVFYKWIEKNNYPDNLQILCFNCNMGKHFNGGICPHNSHRPIIKIHSF